MAGRVDILLKLVGDARSAVSAMNDTTQAAKRTEAEVAKAQGGVQKFLTSIPGVATAATAALAFVDNQLGQLQDTIANAQQARATRDLALAGSPAETAKGLLEQAQAGAEKRRLSLTNPLTWSPSNILADYGSPLGSLLGLGGRARRQRRDQLLEQQLVNMTPEELARVAPYLPQARELLPAVTRAYAYQHAGTNITNIYPKGTNPRAVDQNMSRYERVNGRSRRP